MKEYISINFLPNAIYSPELCIRTTIAAAEKANFPLEKIIFEVTKSEQINDPKKLLSIFSIITIEVLQRLLTILVQDMPDLACFLTFNQISLK